MHKRYRLWACSAALFLPLMGYAQSTCYTNPQGVTLCSTPRGVINGSTNQVGNSVYRDDRGNRLDFDTDQFGNASVETQSGDTVQWSNPVLGEKKDPDLRESVDTESATAAPAAPAGPAQP